MTFRHAAFVVALSVALLAGPAAAGPQAGHAPGCVAGSGGFPRPLVLPNAEPNGVFDPNLARDPETGRLWMAYSSVTGPAGSGLVSTHLARSDDQGTTWCHVGVVNRAEEVPRGRQPSRVARAKGHWSHEVPAIVHDPGAPGDARWRLIWHRYLHVEDSNPKTDDRRFEHGWLAQKVAPSAGGLLSAREQKLIAAAAYTAAPQVEAYNSTAPGGRPQWLLAEDPQLQGCLAVTEPGVIASGGALYLAMFCFRDEQEQDVVLVRYSHGTRTWRYLSTLLSRAEATAINPALIGFNAADIVAVGDTHRLLASPMAGAGYLGCIGYDLSLAAGRLRDVDGRPGPDPVFAHRKNEDPGVYQTGACTFDETSPLGVIVGDTHVTGVQFRLFATGQRP